MSRAAIRTALETRLAAQSPALLTAWENVSFSPPSESTPYQRVNLLFATPDNREAGAVYQEIGYLQVTLVYPMDAGAAAAEARAESLKSWFKKGTSLVSSGTTVVVDKTPAIGNGTVDVDRWALPVKIPFHAQVVNN